MSIFRPLPKKRMAAAALCLNEMQAEELCEVRFVKLEDAVKMLNPWSARKLPFALRAYKNGTPVYLEDGQEAS